MYGSNTGLGYASTIRHRPAKETTMPLLGNDRYYTESCAPKGDGICDGFDPYTMRECLCHCHNAFDLPDTQAEVKVWHDEMWGICQ